MYAFTFLHLCLECQYVMLMLIAMSPRACQSSCAITGRRKWEFEEDRNASLSIVHYALYIRFIPFHYIPFSSTPISSSNLILVRERAVKVVSCI